MADKQKTKQELIQELDILRQRVAGLEQSELARKRAEVALRESEEKYRAVFENTGTATVVIEGNSIISLANAEFVRLSGYSLGELEGQKSWTEFVVKEDLDRMQAQHRLRRQNAERALRHYEFRFVRRNGDIRNIYLSIDVILGTTKSVASLLDITERKQAEESLRESEIKYREIFESLEDLYYRTDNQGIIQALSPSLNHLTGWEAEELIGKPVVDVYVDPSSRERLLSILAQDGFVRDYEVLLKKKDGTAIPASVGAHFLLDEQGRPVGVGGILRDITERKRAEEALRENEEQYRSLFETSTNAILIRNRAGTITMVNEAAISLLRSTKRDDLIGKAYLDFVHPEDRALSAERIKKIFQIALDQPEPYQDATKAILPREHRMVKMNGEVIYVESTAVAFHYKRELFIQGIFRNITERKRAEEELRESEERFRDLYDTAPVGYHEYDMEARITNVNQTILEMLGYSPQEMIGQYMWKFNDEEDIVRQQILEKLAGLRPPGRNLERIYRRKDGTTLPVLIEDRLRKDEQGRITSIRCIIQDITDLKRAEETLRKSEEQARQLAQENAIMAEIGRIVSATLNISEVYERFAEQVQKLISFDRININLIDHQARTATSAYSSGRGVKGRQIGDVFPLNGTAVEEIIRTHSGLLLHPQDQAELERRVPGLVPSFQAGHRSMMVVPLISKGKVIAGLYFGSTKSNLFNDRDLRLAELIGAQIAGTIANAQLFTERQRLEERLRRAEKMEALGTLAGGVAHDLNNVLGVLVGYSELLLMEIQEGNSLRTHVSNILQSGKRAAAIIQDLLALARRGIAVSEVVNLNDVISDYFKTPEFERLKAYHPQVIFKADLDKNLLNIKGSPVHLIKTIMNLLSNAAEAITDQGKVTIVTENRYLDKPITGYDHIQGGDYVVSKVLDNGNGISAQDMRKIFEPFYTKKVMGRSGTGLGLAVVWGTVKDHSGYIDVQSEEGKGSTFTLYFPVTREEMTKGQPSISPESYRGRGESILVVDDVKEQRDLATAMLNRLGYRVSSVSSGDEAVTYLKENRVDLLVLDMIMDPGMDGLETYQKVFEINPKQKAIIVSGFSETDRVKKAQELGAGPYVRKPYIQERIGLAIRKELDK